MASLTSIYHHEKHSTYSIFFFCACAWAVTELRILRAALSGRDARVRFVRAQLDFSVGKIQKGEESYSQKNIPKGFVPFTNFGNVSQNFPKFTHVYHALDLLAIQASFIRNLVNYFLLPISVDFYSTIQVFTDF